MDHRTLEQAERWFERYTSSFLRGDARHDDAIRLKVDHTRRVCAEIVRLAVSIGASEVDVRTAEAAALLHDVGRFEQFSRYGTFNDRLSVNHAHLGTRILARERLLSPLPRYRRTLLLRAVACHNAATIPDLEDPTAKMHMRLIRDADKLDIWRVFLGWFRREDRERNPSIALDLPDLPDCSDRILRSIHEGRFARMDDLRTLNDFKLLQLSWVFDLHFPASFEAVSERGIIDHIAERLPTGDERVRSAIEAARSHVRRSLTHGLDAAAGPPHDRSRS